MFFSRNICVSQNIYHNISKIGASIYSPFELNKSLLKYALREFDLFCCKSRLWLPFLLNRFKRFTHFTWLVVFFWSHFLFQWFWFLSIIEVSKVFLRTTSMTINKWVQKDRKGSRLRDKLPITTIREKSLKKGSLRCSVSVPKWY